MRRKDTVLLALTWLMLGICAIPAGRAWAAGGSAALKAVTVSAGPAGTELVLHMSGPYTFRTLQGSPSTLFIDLTNAKVVGAARNQQWENPVLLGYKLVSYQDATSQPIVRVLLDEKQAQPFVVRKDGVGLHLIYATAGSSQTEAPATQPAAPPSQPKALANVFSTPNAPASQPKARATVSSLPIVQASQPKARATISSVPAVPAAQPVSPATVSENLLVSNVTLEKQDSGETFVDVATSGNASYHVSTLPNPRRLIVDIDGLRQPSVQKSYPAETPVLKDIRVGQFHVKDPSVVRVVADLNGNPIFDVHATPQGVRIELRPRGQQSSTPLAVREPAPVAKPQAAAPVTVAVVKPVPVVAPERHAPAPAPKVGQEKREVAAVQPPAPKPGKQMVISADEKVEVAPKPVVAPAVASIEKIAPKPVVASASASDNRIASKAAVVPAVAPAVAVVKVTPPAKPVEAVEREVTVAPPVQAETHEEVKPEVHSTLPVLAASNQELAAPLPAPASVTPEALRADRAALTLDGERNEASQSAIPAGLEGPYGDSKTTYTGETISLNLKDVDLKDFFRLIHEISGLNIILDPNVAGSVTLVLDSVPWDQALDIVLKNNRLGKVMEGNVLRIARIETLTAEQEGVTKLAAARMDASPLVTVFRPINYAKAMEIATLLKTWSGGGALTRRGTVLVDVRSNTLIISDVQAQIPTIEAIVTKLDKKAKQVSIEARVVLATADFTRSLSASLLGGFKNASTVTTATTGSTTSSISIPTPVAGAFPISTATNATASGFGVASIVNVGANYFINAAISAAEERDQAKTISRPSIVTQNNVEGMVMQGVQVPIQTSINNTIAVQYENATLQLTVTPQVTEDDHIFLKIMVNNASVGAVITGAGPSINTQQATTSVLVPDGGTVVFGGITVTSRSKSATYIPLLGNIPVLGHLFKSSNSTDQDQELLFFVTPKILPG